MIDIQNDILNHGGRDHGKGNQLQDIGSEQPQHAAGQRNGKRLKDKHRGGEANRDITVKASEKTVIQEHHGYLHKRGIAAEQTHVRSVAAHIADDIDQIIVYQIMGEKKHCNTGKQTEKTLVLAIEL